MAQDTDTGVEILEHSALSGHDQKGELVPVKKNEFGAYIKQEPIDWTTAKPVKPIPNIVADKNPRYHRPLTDEERAAAVVDLGYRERGEQVPIGLKAERAIESPEAKAITEAVLMLPVTAIQAARGVAGAVSPNTDMWNMIVDSAKKGILEPDKVEPTSVAIMNAYPKTDWKLAGVIGTLAEAGILYSTPNLFKMAEDAGNTLTKDSQVTAGLNKMRQNPAYLRNVEAVSAKLNIPMDEVDNAFARGVWEQRNNINYWSVLKYNLREYTGVDLFSESGQIPLKGEEPKITNAIIRVGDKVFEGANHGEAVEQAIKAGAFAIKAISTPTGEGKVIEPKEDKDYMAGFRVSDGRIIDRKQAKKEFNITRSHQIPEQEYQQGEAPQSFVKARIRQLEGEADNISKQMKLLEDEKEKLIKHGLTTGMVDTKLMELSKKFDYLDSNISELMIDRTTLSDIKNKTLQMKAEDILREETQIEKDARRTGIMEGTDYQKKHQAEVKMALRERERAKEEINKMVSQINRLPTQNLPLDYKDKIEEIKSNFDLKKRTAKTLAKRDSMRDFIAKQVEESGEINIPQEKLDLLDKTPLNDMSLQELKDAHETIMRLYHQGTLKDKLLTAQEGRSFEAIVKEGVDVITKSEGLTEETPIIKALREQEPSLKNQSLDMAKNFYQRYVRPEVMINSLDNWTQGINTKCLWDNINNADESKSISWDKSLTHIEEIHKGLITKDIFKRQKIGRFNNMSKDNALFIYANSFNENNLRHLYGSGITEADIKDITTFLTDEEKQTVKNMLNWYDSYQYPELEKVYSELEGVHLGKEENYFPIDNLEDITYNKELEKSILEKSYIRKAGVSKGFTKERVSSSKGFNKFNYFSTIYRNLQKVEHYKAYAKPIRDINKYLSNPEVKIAIEQKFGKLYYKILDKWLKDCSYGNQRMEHDWILQAAKWARTRFAPTVLGFNLNTVLKQPIGFIQGMQMAGKVSSLNALRKFSLHPIRSMKFVNDKSVLMKFRSMRQEREFEEIINSRGTLAKFGKVTGYQWFVEKSLLPVLFVDRIVATSVWMGAYDNTLKQGIDEAGAIKEANRVVRRTQPMGGTIHLPDMFRGNEAQKLITFLKGHTNKFFNLQYEMNARRASGRDSNGKWAVNALYYALIPACVTFLVEEKRQFKEPKEIIGAIGKQATMSLYGIESFFNYLESGYFTLGDPLTSYLQLAQKVFTAKKLDKKIDNALFLASGIAEFPYVGVRRIAQAGEKLGEGKPLEALGKLVGVKEPKKKGERRGTPEKRNVSQVRNQRNQFNADRAFKEMMK